MKDINNGQSASMDVKNMQPIPGFEKEYLISEFGDVWSIRSRQFLKPRVTKDGYLTVVLNVKKRYEMRVHRIVAMTFLESSHGYEVNHIDANKANNHYKNLEWCSHNENMKHGARLGLFKSKKPIRKAYKFTSAFTGDSFILVGVDEVRKHFNYADNSSGKLFAALDTGKYIKGGKLNGLMVDSIDIRDQRLFREEVDSSESKS